MLERASFVISVVSLLVTISAFIRVESQALRYALAGFFLAIAVIFAGTGIFFRNISTPSDDGVLDQPLVQESGVRGSESDEPDDPSSPVITTEINNLPNSVCGSAAFEGNSHVSRDPLFMRPDGYTSGWITSDPSDIVLLDGTVRTITQRYVLIVEDLSELQFRNVPFGSAHANIWGCWFRSDLNGNVMLGAESEYEKILKPAEFYRVSSSGLESLR